MPLYSSVLTQDCNRRSRVGPGSVMGNANWGRHWGCFGGHSSLLPGWFVLGAWGSQMCDGGKWDCPFPPHP